MYIPKKKIGCLGSLVFICFLIFVISFAIFTGGILAIIGTVFVFIIYLVKLILLILYKFYDAIEHKYETKRAEGKLTFMGKILNAFNMKNWEKTKDKQPENVSHATIETSHYPETIQKEENLERFMIECNARLAHQDEMAQYGIYDEQEE